MKKYSIIILVGLLLVAGAAIAAMWSTYGELSASNIADTDKFLVLDVSDTTLGAGGTQKQYSWASIKADILSWLAGEDVTTASMTVAKSSGVAGDIGLYEANSTDTHGAGFRGPNSITGDGAYRIKLPNARPGGENYALVSTNSGESGTGTAADPYVQTGSFIHVPQVIASGSVALSTNAIAGGACTVAQDGGTATGVLTTDVIDWTPAANPTTIVGYAPASTGSLYIWAYPTADHVNFKVCNGTQGQLTPGALTLNWMVRR